MVCLDTDTIIHLLRNNIEVTKRLNNYLKEGYSLTTTAINSFELWNGIEKSPNVNREKALRTLLSSIRVLPLDEPSSKKAANIFEKLKSRGEMVDELDVLIAAIAISHNEELLTYNKKHFERISELTLL